ncbi:MAG: CapA family protein [candidate division WOR-3 bacterium]|uniref:Capsule synthesis protein CapA domain-containing protein n=1 Tax=candidate division WOR-3 bacterium TaxID=2052148 RepID=A0A7C1NPW5_UNCW3|nr:CapA family protein [candidate division WOR-3 bacterium]
MNGLLLFLLVTVSPPACADTVENFESGAVELYSFPGEDQDPDLWLLDSSNTHQGSHFSLKLIGNTWKIEPVSPFTLDTGTVLAVAACIEAVGEIQGFGLIGEGETLVYALAGREKVDPARWSTVYQGAFPVRTWNRYLLPVGEDWLARFGRLATISGLVFVNDHDSSRTGSVLFDDILNITPDLPAAPELEIWHELRSGTKNGDGTWSVTVQFYSRVTDPDSRYHRFFWSFGDDSTSQDSCPLHTYIIRDDHLFTVLCQVSDSTGRWARDTTRVRIEPGPSRLPLKLNFAGDIMLARRYEQPGGIIDTLGPEGVFARIRHLLADSADLTVANLECPLTDRGTPHPTKPIIFRGRPSNVRGLSYAGIDLVSLANNHILDYGLEGLLQTRQVLDSSGIISCGAGEDIYQAFQPAFIVKSGVNLGFLAFSDRTGQYDNYQPFLNAGYNKPGFAEQDSWRIFHTIARTRQVADFVIVQLHAGEEYQETPGFGADDEWFSPRAERPQDNARTLRHRIIDNGADLIVCHHPHILQGIEVYQGKVIAHSLGNFAFDQEYPETYPTVILHTRLDEQGFRHFLLIPVFIDDYLPTPATGELGIAILRHLARLSRELGTYVIVNRESVLATVILDTGNLNRYTSELTTSTPVLPDSGWFVSPPLRLDANADISRLTSISPAADWQFRLGRDLIWFGNMEDEGATMWLLNQPDEFYDPLARRGQRSLAQRRPAGTGTIITSIEERYPLPADSGDLTVYSWVRGENAGPANIRLNLYPSRTGGIPVQVCSLVTPLWGTFDWRFESGSIAPLTNTGFLDLWLTSAGPDSGTGIARFDDAGVISWTPWQDFMPGTEIPTPNEYSWLQLRTRTRTNQAQLNYQTVSYRLMTGVTSPAHPSIPAAPRLSVQPSHPRLQTAISYVLPRTAQVRLAVYNPAGQKVRTLVNQLQPAGNHRLLWNLTADSGRPLPSGTYFLLLATDTGTAVRRVICVNSRTPYR